MKIFNEVNVPSGRENIKLYHKLNFKEFNYFTNEKCKVTVRVSKQPLISILSILTHTPLNIHLHIWFCVFLNEVQLFQNIEKFVICAL